MCTRATLAEVRKLQKAAGIITEGEDYSLEEMLDEKAPFKVTDEFCADMMASRGGGIAYTCSPESTGTPGLSFCWPKNAVMDICCDHNAPPAGRGLPGCKNKPQHEMSENDDINEAIAPCAPYPDGTKTIPFSTGPKSTDFICLPANTKLFQNGVALKPKTTAVAPAPRFGAQPLTK